MDKTEAFKEALEAGIVTFSYQKKDGTIREANGTLCKALLPLEQAPTIKFKCTNINWDTDGRGQCGLPKTVTIELDEAYFKEAGLDSPKMKDELSYELANELTDKYGFCVLDYKYERIEKRSPKKMAEGMVLYYDTDKAGFRSLHESTLLDWKAKA